MNNLIQAIQAPIENVQQKISEAASILADLARQPNDQGKGYDSPAPNTIKIPLSTQPKLPSLTTSVKKFSSPKAYNPYSAKIKTPDLPKNKSWAAQIWEGYLDAMNYAEDFIDGNNPSGVIEGLLTLVAPTSLKIDPYDDLQFGGPTQVQRANPDAHLTTRLEPDLSTLLIKGARSFANFILPDPAATLESLGECKETKAFLPCALGIWGIAELLPFIKVGKGLIKTVVDPKDALELIAKTLKNEERDHLRDTLLRRNIEIQGRRSTVLADVAPHWRPSHKPGLKKPRPKDRAQARKETRLRARLETPPGWASPFVKEDWLVKPWPRRIGHPGEMHESAMIYFLEKSNCYKKLRTRQGTEAKLELFNKSTGQNLSRAEYQARFAQYKSDGTFVALEEEILRSVDRGMRDGQTTFISYFADGARDSSGKKIEGFEEIFPITSGHFSSIKKRHPHLGLQVDKDRVTFQMKLVAGTLTKAEEKQIFDLIVPHAHLSSVDIAKETGLPLGLVNKFRSSRRLLHNWNYSWHPDVRDEVMSHAASEGMTHDQILQYMRKNRKALEIPDYAQGKINPTTVKANFSTWVSASLSLSKLEKTFKQFGGDAIKELKPKDLAKIRKEIRRSQGVDLHENYWAEIYAAYISKTKVYGLDFSPRPKLFW